MADIWEVECLKDRESDARETALAEQADNDWESAVVQHEQIMSDIEKGFETCQLPACRRARRCVGNKPVCMPRCQLEFPPGAERKRVEELYADIQQERCNAAAEGRKPDVIRAMTHRVHQEEEEQVEDESAPTPARGEAERSSRPVPEAPRSAPSQPVPQPQLGKSEPPASPPAAPVLPAAKAPPPEPEPRSPPDVEERVNRIWAEYVASPEEFSARRRGPRIRML